jgi:CO dehydrogenase maturation factor
MCRAHAAVRHLLSGMLQEPEILTVIDMEAGLEHLSRGTDRHVDVLLVVAEPYFKGLETARRCADLGRELGIANIFGVANKFRSDQDLVEIRNFAATHGISLAGEIPFDPAIYAADQAGCAPDLLSASPAVAAVGRLVEQLKKSGSSSRVGGFSNG